MLWLNSLEVWPVPITDLYQEMRNGLMLCNMMMCLIPGCKITGTNGRPRTRGPALRNIEKGLTVMWQHCQPNARRMPSAGKLKKVWFLPSNSIVLTDIYYLQLFFFFLYS